MIISIGGLVIPETLSGNVEQFNKDSRRRTVSERLIIKLSPKQVWRATLNYEGRAIPSEYRVDLYNKCRAMRNVAEPVVFVSPYDGLIYSVDMFCTEPFPPKLVHIVNNIPVAYASCGAVFEEQ